MLRLHYRQLVILFLFCLPCSAANTWYVAAHCTNNGNGTASSCAASPGAAGAWKIFSNIVWASVVAGDTVNIAATQNETYTAGLTVASSGSSGNVITITVTSGNVATIDATGLTGAIINFGGQQYVTIDGINGSAVTGNTSYGIKVTNLASTAGVNTYCAYENNGGGNLIIQHVECTGAGAAEPDDNGGGFYLQGTSIGGIHTRYNWIHSSAAPTHWFGTGSSVWCATSTTNFTDCTQEHNKVEYMYNDGLRCSSNCTLDSNEVAHVDTSGHSDSLLCQSGSYCAVANNYVHDSGDQNIYLDNLYDAVCHHIRIYNNVIASDPGFGVVIDPEGGAGAAPAATGCTTGTATWDDVEILNNTFGKTSAASIRTSGRGTASNLVFENNIYGPVSNVSYWNVACTTGTTISFTSSSSWDYGVYSTTSANYPSIVSCLTANTLAQLQALTPARETNGKTGNPTFVSSSDFHLSASDTVARGAATNLLSTYPFLATDKDGIVRPVAAVWDTGAYQYTISGSGISYITVSSSRITVTAGRITVNAGVGGLVAYNGVDVIQWPSIVPNLGGLTDNGATVYDTSLLGHRMWDGSNYGNPSFLSPITRVTDSVSAPGRQYKSYTAGQGGSGVFTLTNTDTTIVGINETSFERMCIFNHALAPGRCLPTSSYTAAGSTSAQPASGIVITTNMNNAGGGSSSTPTDFGSSQFSSTDKNTIYTFGSDSHLTNPLTVTPVTISTTPTTLGIYTIGSTIADFTYGMPVGTMAPEWLTGHAYNNGDYVTHTLTAGEMATSGTWTALTTYTLGDIVTSGGAGAGNCMYRVIAVVSGSSGTSGSTSPTFDTTAPCANDTLPSGTTFDGSVRWRGTNSLAKFVYQNTGANCTSGASFTISGHPDLLSTVSDGVGGCTSWQSMGPSYVPTQDSMLWSALGGVSNDTSYSGHASKYLEATSTDSYGGPTSTADSTRYKNYAAGQGTGIWIHYYDATANSYHLLNTATGIWTKTTCTGGTGYNCSGGTWSWSTVGTLTAISNNPTIGHACPFATHNSKLDPTGNYVEVQEQVFFDTSCNPLTTSLIWKPQAAFNASTSLQFTPFGTGHWCLTPSKFVVFNAQAWGYTAGVFLTQYDITNVSGGTTVYSVYLQPFPNQSCAQVSNPPGSYITSGGTIKSPDSNLSEVTDSHLSCAAPSSGYTCGTTYNYATLSPIAFNAFQNMETCYPLTPTGTTTGTAATCTSTPLTSIGPVKQYTHTFATGANLLFSTQFQISEYSQDGKWLLWSSDWNCSLGSIDGTVPVVNADGFLGHLPVSPVPASPGSFCGLPWQASHAYVVGNIINPIENTSGSGGVDDVYQAVAVNGTGTSGPPSSLSNNQPKCGTTSCWIQTTAPTASTAGTYVCDSSDGLSNLVSATLPTCTNGIIWQDVGPQTSRGDVFAVRLAN